jgi:hypothetical protein
MIQKMMWFGVLLLGWSITAHAQVGACPPGTIPNGNQYNMMSCAPDPNYDRQSQQPAPPPPIWVDRWGATAGAVPSSLPAFGAAADMPTKAAAEAAAVAKCEATPNAKCYADVTYHNQCYAETWGEKAPVGYTAPTLSEAKALSMESCKAHGNKQCIPYYSACSLPIRIQ